MNKFSKEIFVRLPLVLAGLWVSLIVFMTLMQNSLIYFPATDKPNPKAFGQKDVEIISVTTEDGLSLEGWFKKSASENAPVLVVFHGNAGHIGYRTHFFDSFVPKGLDVLLAEYRGYGGNPGKPNETGLYADARAYMTYLLNARGYEPQKIILYGESLGTGVAVEMATHYNIGALILEAPYDSLVELASTHHPYIPFLRFLMKDKYESIDKISKITAPKLFLKAGKDFVIPHKHTDALYEASPPPKEIEIFQEAQHNNFYFYDVDTVVIDFLIGYNIHKNQ